MGRLKFPKVPITLCYTLLILTLKSFRHHLLKFRSGRCLRGLLFQPSYFTDGAVKAPGGEGTCSRSCSLAEARIRTQAWVFDGRALPPFPAHLASPLFSTALLFAFFLVVIHVCHAVLQRPLLCQRLCLNLNRNPEFHGRAFSAPSFFNYW